uniref:Pif-4 n=1 Tax=Trichoplusia ni single nucleopolyhedrovirus TaxID=332054 RepID=A0A481V9U6_9ABAC|nr:pif-4 [Trichoplusia ni single nucleopolyhedrovirus]
MFSKMVLDLIGSAAILGLLIFLMALLFINPYRRDIERLVRDHKQTLQFGAYIDVFDLSTSQQIERLFIIKPENVILYNTNGSLFYYLASTSLLCPNEFSLVRFTRPEIVAFNDSGQANTVCTSVNSLVIIEHFMTLKNNIADDRILLSVDEIHYTIIDIINLLISLGYVYLQ